MAAVDVGDAIVGLAMMTISSDHLRQVVAGCGLTRDEIEAEIEAGISDDEARLDRIEQLLAYDELERRSGRS